MIEPICWRVQKIPTFKSRILWETSILIDRKQLLNLIKNGKYVDEFDRFQWLWSWILIGFCWLNVKWETINFSFRRLYLKWLIRAFINHTVRMNNNSSLIRNKNIFCESLKTFYSTLCTYRTMFSLFIIVISYFHDIQMNEKYFRPKLNIVSTTQRKVLWCCIILWIHAL